MSSGVFMLLVSRGTLRCHLVEADVRPFLGHKACIGMQLIKVLDSDDVNRPVTGDRPMFAVRDADDPLTKEQLVSRFPNLFADGIGKLDGNYHIRLDPGVDPVQHAPRRVPVALRSKLQTTLNEMVEQDVLAPVTTPTPGISSIIIDDIHGGTQFREEWEFEELPASKGPAVQREHYPLPTIEEIATRLHGGNVFAILDVRSGFWHICLDDEPY